MKYQDGQCRWSKIYTFNCARANPELIDFAKLDQENGASYHPPKHNSKLSHQ
ncbi:hypothetical protein KFK09_011755 [Dendrobium nobile]|uniref:Uncharacterized protein n=1 Tax=Dendrobium nobile TaxID=94219 RepID=A0A8T3BGS0_DENNO|nr:hypothetical protein KFK09_011755 [Dendrobium nobile]